MESIYLVGHHHPDQAYKTSRELAVEADLVVDSSLHSHTVAVVDGHIEVELAETSTLRAKTRSLSEP